MAAWHLTTHSYSSRALCAHPRVSRRRLIGQLLPAHAWLQAAEVAGTQLCPCPTYCLPSLMWPHCTLPSLAVFYCQPALPGGSCWGRVCSGSAHCCLQEVSNVFWVQRRLDVQFSGFAVFLHYLQPQGGHLCFFRSRGRAVLGFQQMLVRVLHCDPQGAAPRQQVLLIGSCQLVHNAPLNLKK